MSLINEALKQAELAGGNEQSPADGAKRSTYGVKHLYNDKASPDQPATEEEISRLFGKNQTGLRGAAILGICVIITVAVVMHLTLPPDQSGPAEAEAGSTTAPSEAQTATPAEEPKTAPDKSPLTASLQQALAKALNGSAAQTSETAPPADATGADADEPQVGNRSAGKQFRLSGILASGGKGYAIINNHMVSVGDEIDGARVIVIGKYHVVLEKDSKRLVLRM